MANNNVLTIDDLKLATGYQRPSDVEQCLKANNIKTFTGKNGVWTTLSLVDAAGGIVINGNNQGNESVL